MTDFLNTLPELFPPVFLPLGIVSLLVGWPLLAYYFWTRNELQTVAPTWKVVSISCLVSWLAGFLLLRENALIRDGLYFELRDRGAVFTSDAYEIWRIVEFRADKFSLAIQALAAIPPICLAAYGCHRIWRRLRPVIEEEEPASTRLFS